MTAAIYTGELRKGDAPGMVVGAIRAEPGWGITIRGTLTAPTCLSLTGFLGEGDSTRPEPYWRGFLNRDHLTWTGRLTSGFGERIELVGDMAVRGCLTLTGTLGPVPDALRVPLLDDVK